MRYEGQVFRPPSEANSLILQATIGCSYNRCAFCAMYQRSKFRFRELGELEEDLRTAKEYLGDRVQRVFLADGDALIMKTERMKELLTMINDAFPGLIRVGAYATPQSLLQKTVEELEALKELKLSILYLGVESGSAEVLKRLKKGVDPEKMIRAGRRAVDAGMKLSTMIILGAGGTELKEEHAQESARVLNAISPRFISTLSMMVVPGTPLFDDMDAGLYEPPDPRQTLEELRGLIAGLEVNNAVFRSNHISNFLPLAGSLMKDKAALLARLDAALAGPIPDEFGPQGF
ncbi:MAG: radical SAM protein [Planctomycetota bacterium]